MNTTDYNQIALQKSVLDAPELLKEGESCNNYYQF